MKIRLRSFIVLFFVIVVIVPGLISLLLCRSLFRDFIFEEIDHKNESFIQMMKMQVDAYLHQPVNDLIKLADRLNNEIVAESDVFHQLDLLTDAHVYFDSVRAISSSGSVFAVSPFDDEVLGTDVSRMEYFANVRGGVGPYWAPSFISEQLNQPMATISIPWKGGVLVGFLRLGELSAMVHPVDDDGSIFAVTDQTGTFIAHTNPKAVAQRRVCPIYTKVGQGPVDAVERHELYRKNGLYYCYFSAVGFTGWSIVSCQPASVIDESINELTYVFLLIGCVVSAVFVIIAFFILKNVLDLFQSLIRSSNDMASGDYSVAVPESFVYEISELSDNFNIMANHIKTRDTELRWKNEELKLEVEVRTRKENEVEEIRTYLDKLIEAMPAALIGVTPDLEVVHCNSAARKMFSRGSSDSHLLHEIVPQEICSALIVEEASASGDVGRYDKVRYICNELEEFYDIVIYPLGGSDKSVVIKIECVTEKIRMGEIMLQTEKMTSVGGLAAGMAHEINNPLAVIMQSLQNGLRRLSPDIARNQEEARKYHVDLNNVHQYMVDRSILKFLESGLESCRNAAGIVKNMLQFSRKADSQLIQTDLSAIVDKSIELGCSDYDLHKKYDFKFVNVIKQYAENLPDVMCCVQEIEQVLLNLFKNALQAMEKIDDEQFQPKLILRLSTREAYVRLEIEDNGPGIPEEIQHRIFEPFFTTKPTGVGTGLGLSVSYMIITQNHSGIMNVHSLFGQGTTFVIELPVHR